MKFNMIDVSALSDETIVVYGAMPTRGGPATAPKKKPRKGSKPSKTAKKKKPAKKTPASRRKAKTPAKKSKRKKQQR
jgi:hypothetical protein